MGAFRAKNAAGYESELAHVQIDVRDLGQPRLDEFEVSGEQDTQPTSVDILTFEHEFHAMAKRREILLLEDDMIQSMLFRAAIDNIHGTVSNFSDAEQALQVASRSPFDLYIVDLGIFLKPGVYDQLGGIQFVASIRKAVTQTAPIIIATGDRSAKPLLECFRSGADDYVLKDEGIEKVVGRLRRWMSQLPFTQAGLEEKREQVLKFLVNAAEKGIELPG